MLSIYEIAKGAKVSPATVSRALNPELRHKVKTATLEKILSFCEANDYYGKLAARSLASGKTYCIGLVLGVLEQDFASPFFALVLRGIVDGLARRGYTLKIIPVPHGDRKEDDKNVRKALLANEVDGFFLSASMIGDITLDELSKRKFPAVVVASSHVDFRACAVPTVAINNTSGFRALAEYWKERNFAQVAVLGNDRLDPRSRILREEADKLGIETVEFYFDGLQVGTPVEIFSMYEQIKIHWTVLKGFSAWHCVTDLWALGALKAMRELSPECSIFLSGYDNIEENPNFRGGPPVLSTIEAPLRELGECAVNTLLDFEHAPQLNLLDSRFILRTSKTSR